MAAVTRLSALARSDRRRVPPFGSSRDEAARALENLEAQRADRP
jgi:hypothetical protein